MVSKFIVAELFKDEPPIKVIDLANTIRSVSNSYRSAEAFVKRMTGAKYQPAKKYAILEIEIKKIIIFHTDVQLKTTDITNSNLIG